MKTIITSIVICLGLLHAGIAGADGKKLVVVVAKGSSVTNMSRSDLKRCFTGESISAGDKTLVPFNAPPNSPDRTGFDKAVLGMSPDEVGRFWVDRKVRGQSGAPRSLPSPARPPTTRRSSAWPRPVARNTPPQRRTTAPTSW